MQIIQAIIFVVATFFGGVDSGLTPANSTVNFGEGYLWCEAYPEDPVCRRLP